MMLLTILSGNASTEEEDRGILHSISTVGMILNWDNPILFLVLCHSHSLTVFRILKCPEIIQEYVGINEKYYEDIFPLTVKDAKAVPLTRRKSLDEMLL
jgi:hypothetical protein